MNFTKTIKTAVTYTTASIAALAVIALYPRDRRNYEINLAKRNIAERKAQKAQAELAQTKRQTKKVKESETKTAQCKPHKPQPVLLPALTEIPNPWDLEFVSAPESAQTTTPMPPIKHQICLPPATLLSIPATDSKWTANKLKKLTVRELKVIASNQKIRSYSKMKKAELITELSLILLVQ